MPHQNLCNKLGAFGTLCSCYSCRRQYVRHGDAMLHPPALGLGFSSTKESGEDCLSDLQNMHGLIDDSLSKSIHCFGVPSV